jgi:2,4-dienoyl-CoA reductase-like NADH-dependent reductase (Old Yellow Enzyme family)
MPAELDEPLTLPCGVRLRNRIAKAAMTEGLADSSNRATAALETLYRRWAHGGAGLLLTGNIQIDRQHLERPGNVAIDGAEDAAGLAALERFAEAAQERGAHAFAQLSHAGRQTPIYINKTPQAPSAIGLALPGKQFGAPQAMTAEAIEGVIARFAHAASIAKSAGFAGVQVHAAHGYLISSFLNPRANQRSDQWGGSLDNRARLLMRVVAAVRAKVGSGFAVSVKLNSSDFQQGGFSFDECKQVIAWLNEAGVDLLEISGGSYEQPSMMDMEGLEPPHEARRVSTRAREAYFLQYAEEAARVAKMPLMVTGGFRTRAVMDRALASGAADVIGIGRPLCVDPDAPAKLLSGEARELPSYEKSLRLGDGFWGPQSSSPMMKALNGFAAMAFFYKNIELLSRGEAGRSDLALLPAFVSLQMNERARAQKLQKAR